MSDNRHYLSTAGYRFASDHFYVLGRDLRVHTFDLQGHSVLDPIQLLHWDSFGINKIYHIGARAGDFVHWCYARYGVSRITNGQLAWSNKKLGGNGSLWFASYSEGVPSHLSIFGSKGPRCTISAVDGNIIETYRSLQGLCSSPSSNQVLLVTAKGLKWQGSNVAYCSTVKGDLRDIAITKSGVILAGWEEIVLLDHDLKEEIHYSIDRPMGAVVSDSASGPVAVYANMGKITLLQFSSDKPVSLSYAPADHGVALADDWEMTIDLISDGQYIVSDSFIFNIKEETFHGLRYS